jgi:hypothetical protein
VVLAHLAKVLLVEPVETLNLVLVVVLLGLE